MKRSLLFFFIFLNGILYQRPMYAAEIKPEAAYVRDGVIVAVPVSLPVVGVRADTQQVVFDLLGADAATRNACGYYLLVRFNSASLVSNEVVTARAWVLEPPNCIEVVTIGHRQPKITLSRIKLAEVATAQGWGAALMAFIASDPVIAVRWYSSEPLVAGSEEMQPFLAGFAAAVGVSVADLWPLLDACREEGGRR